MRRLAAILAALSLFATAGIARAGGVPPIPHLVGAWSHAEINLTIKSEPHTLVLDRGRIIGGSEYQVTLREHDGSTVQVPLSRRTIVMIKGVKHAQISSLRRNMRVLTMRIDGGAAVRLRVLR